MTRLQWFPWHSKTDGVLEVLVHYCAKEQESSRNVCLCEERSTGLVFIGITVYQTGDLNWLGDSQGLRQNILQNPAPVQWGFIFPAHKVKDISFSHVPFPFFFLSFLFTLHHLGLPQARLSLLFQAAPAREPLQQLLLHSFVSGAHQSQSHCLGSSQPCPCSECFFWGFLGSCLPIKGQFLTLLSRELVENKLFLG